MSLVVVLLALGLLMFVAYRGFSVILFAPICAMLAVLLTDPALVAPVFSGVFMDKMVTFVKSYLPVFILGAVFGKMIELSGFARSIVTAAIDLVGRTRSMLSIVIVCALLTYGGVSLFVVVFAVYPFAAEMFRQGAIPKRLIPATIALGAFTFTMDSLPGTPQIQNIIPTTFFGTNTWAAPWLGVIGSVFILVTGLIYLEWQRRRAAAAGEGYGTALVNEPEPFAEEKLPNPWLALAPLVVVGVMNKVFTLLIPRFYGTTYSAALPGLAHPVATQVSTVAAIWAVEGALLLGILTVVVFAFGALKQRFADGSKAAVAGALLASINTASEYGFGGVIAALPGFLVAQQGPDAHPGRARERGGDRDRARGHHRVGLGRHEHRPCHHVRSLHRRSKHGRDSTRSPAPRRRHGERRDGHAAAQRRRHHAARRHGPHAQAGLSRRLRHHADQDRRRGGRDRRLLPQRNLLKMRSLLVVLPSLALLAACATTGQPADVRPTGHEQVLVELRAVVTGVDQQRRLLALRSDDGSSTVIPVPGEFRDFEKLRVDDDVVVSYTRAIDWQVKAADQGTPGVSARETLSNPKPGEAPGGSIENAITVTATITALDVTHGTVTLTGPGGQSQTLNADSRADLGRVHVGDLAEITYSEVRGLSVRTDAKR